MSKNDSDSALRPYGDYGPAYARAGFEPVPVVRAQKRPATKGWRTLIGLSAEERDAVYKRYAEHNIGLLAGTILSTGRRFAIIDVDHDGFVRFVQAVLRPFVAGRFGSKGLAIFAQAADGLRSTKLKPAGAPGPLVEMFIDSGMAVVPPSLHPNGKTYEHRGKSLLETDHEELPLLTFEAFSLISHVAKSAEAYEIVQGGQNVKGHDLMLALTSSGIASLTADLEQLHELFDPNYRGNTKAETLEMLQSARDKGLGARRLIRTEFDPGELGPIPLGYTREGNYALRDQVRNIIIVASAPQLLSHQFLLGLAGSEFWADR